MEGMEGAKPQKGKKKTKTEEKKEKMKHKEIGFLSSRRKSGPSRISGMT